MHAVPYRHIVQAAEEHYSLPPGTPPFEYLPVEEQQQQQQEQVRCCYCCCAPGTIWRGAMWELRSSHLHPLLCSLCLRPVLPQYAATTEQVEQPQQHQEQQEGEDRDVRQWAEAAADLAFNATVHQQYLDLPPWPATTHEELAVSWRLWVELVLGARASMIDRCRCCLRLTCTSSCCSRGCLQGAWNFTQSIYDYAASQPMTRVLSWDSPRLVRCAELHASALSSPPLPPPLLPPPPPSRSPAHYLSSLLPPAPLPTRAPAPTAG